MFSPFLRCLFSLSSALPPPSLVSWLGLRRPHTCGRGMNRGGVGTFPLQTNWRHRPNSRHAWSTTQNKPPGQTTLAARGRPGAEQTAAGPREARRGDTLSGPVRIPLSGCQTAAPGCIGRFPRPQRGGGQLEPAVTGGSPGVAGTGADASPFRVKPQLLKQSYGFTW